MLSVSIGISFAYIFAGRYYILYLGGEYMKKTILLLTVMLAALSGCASKGYDDVITSIPSGYKSEIEAYKMQEAEMNKPNPSLWSDVGSSGTIFLDYKERRIGDVVIVKIEEDSSASNSTNNSASKSTTYNASITAMLGLPTNMGITNFLGSGAAFQPTIAATTGNNHQGQGSSRKADSFTATIAARIVDIMPSGNLVIEGNREIIIDQEKQTITLKGIVRQKDIDAANTVSSSAIADAQITYTGAGALSQATKKGWLGKVIDVIWPF